MSLLLNLPPEIRKMIWKEVLSSPVVVVEPVPWKAAHGQRLEFALSHTHPRTLLVTNSVFCNSHIRADLGRDPITYISTSLIRVNKSISQEARAILYNGTIFYFRSPARLHAFLVDVPLPAIQLVQHVAISFDRFCSMTGLFASVLASLFQMACKLSGDEDSGQRIRTLKTIQIVLTCGDLHWLAERSHGDGREEIISSPLDARLPLFDEILASIERASMPLIGVERLIRIVGVEDIEAEGLKAEIQEGVTDLGIMINRLSTAWGGDVQIKRAQSSMN